MNLHLMYVPRLRVAYPEVLVTAMAICARGEVAVERKDIYHQVPLELLYVSSLALAPYKLLPGCKHVLERNNIVVGETP